MTGGTGCVPVGVTLLLWLAFLGFVLFGLHALGGALAPPPLTDPTGLTDWLEERQPAEAAFALLRLAGLATAWYLVGAILINALAHFSRVPEIVRCADLLTLPAVRRFANATAGLSVAAAALTNGTGMHSAGPGGSSPASAEVITLLAHSGAPSSTAGGDPDAGSDSGDDNGAQQKPPLPTLRRLPDDPGAPPPLPTRPPDGTNTPQAPGQEAEPPPGPPSQPEPTLSPGPQLHADPPSEPPPDQLGVRPGQHFWALAESVLAAAWQRAPSDDEVDPYWRQLVAANRAILRDPDNPDLLYPGQVITVPPPPPLHHP